MRMSLVRALCVKTVLFLIMFVSVQLVPQKVFAEGGVDFSSSDPGNLSYTVINPECKDFCYDNSKGAYAMNKDEGITFKFSVPAYEAVPDFQYFVQGDSSDCAIKIYVNGSNEPLLQYLSGDSFNIYTVPASKLRTGENTVTIKLDTNSETFPQLWIKSANTSLSGKINANIDFSVSHPGNLSYTVFSPDDAWDFFYESYQKIWYMDKATLTFKFTGALDFRYNVAGAMIKQEPGAFINIYVNGKVLRQRKGLSGAFTWYIIPADSFTQGENTVIITLDQSSTTKMMIKSATTNS